MSQPRLGLKFDIVDLIKLHRKSQRALVRAMTRTVKRVLIEASNHIQQNLDSRSRALARSWNARGRGKGNHFSIRKRTTGAIGVLGSNLVYAPIQNYGGTIHRKDKLLTIPLPPALTPSGIPRKPSARDWPGLFPITSKAGNLLLVKSKTKGRGKKKKAELVPYYVLKTEVTLPGKHYVEAATKHAESLAVNIAEATIIEELKKAGLT